MGKLYTKEKTQAEQARDDERMDDMIAFWMTFKDPKWNPWFLPVDGGWYYLNPKCKATIDEFNTWLRIYINK